MSETKLNSIPLSLRLSRINFDISAQDQHIMPSLSQLLDRILQKLFLANIKEVIYDLEEKFFFCLDWKQFLFPVLRLRGTILPPPIKAQSKIFFTKPKLLCITNNETVQIQKRSHKNSYFCVPFKKFSPKIRQTHLFFQSVSRSLR